jgi:hypothetical protein
MQTITVSGGNLFAIAAQYLGDATQWIRVALQNGMTDPMLPPGVTTLVIPNVDASQGGGTPPQ